MNELEELVLELEKAVFEDSASYSTNRIIRVVLKHPLTRQHFENLLEGEGWKRPEDINRQEGRHNRRHSDSLTADLEGLKLTDEEIWNITDKGLGLPPESILFGREVVRAQLAKLAPYVEQEKHERDLVWMGKLIDAGIPIMDDPDKLPDELYTKAAIDDARRETAREIENKLYIYFAEYHPYVLISESYQELWDSIESKYLKGE